MIDDIAFATLGIAGPSHKLVASGSAALNPALAVSLSDG